ncbi:MAG: hypothetical protein HZB26_24515 [Candidatus Hydrogenedentes bacterium]|nr:hypothetical protein [Candidatus Hydrogenedentota bacterium]
MRVFRGMGFAVIAAGVLAVAFLAAPAAGAQAAQTGADTGAKAAGKLRFDYVGYRAARWETGKVTEVENDRPNEGGLIQVYFTNISDKPVHVKFYQINGHDTSYWRLGGAMAWDRMFNESDLAPGATGIAELNAVSKDFKAGRPFAFSLVDNDGVTAGSIETTLAEDPIQITNVRVLPGLRQLEVHVRHAGNGQADLASLDLVGVPAQSVKWVGQTLSGSGHAIARVELSAPLAASQTIIVKLGVKDASGARTVYAHRRAFEDYFPIGTWSNAPETYAQLRKLHIDTIIKGGTAEDALFTTDAAKYGFRVIVPAEGAARVDTLRGLGDNPSVASWLLSDEPDWSTVPAVMEHIDASVKQVNKTKPTFMTLCRNAKFFEYASISDIPCMDHYCVAAPSSSKWPKSYGTRLEETAYYTRDLKAASEPKQIWVWTQAIASWDKRPLRPVPTPDELAAQLMLNLGGGAKGVLWFNYEAKVAEKFPDVRDAMQRWGRVLSLTREDFLESDPIAAEVVAPAKVNVAALATVDKLLLCVTNLNYEIDPKAYRFTPAKNVSISIVLPSWLKPASALAIEPDGVKLLSCEVREGRAQVSLGDVPVCRLVVLANDANADTAYESAFTRAIEEEHTEY